MDANFFRQVAELNLTGNLQITIAKGVEDKQIVSVLLLNDGCGDDAKRRIIPYNFRATPEELDNAFFDTITKPLQTVSGLMTNMEAFLKQTENAKKNSAMEKPSTTKGKTDNKADGYTTLMAKVDALDKEGKPKAAWMLLQNSKEFPQHTDAILKRRKELSAKFAPDLFGQNEPETPQQTTVQLDEVETDEPIDSFEDDGEFEEMQEDEY